jgi:hypothetical protein
MLRSAEETAILLAVILNRSGQTRARVSAKTIKILGKRSDLRRSFAAAVTDAMPEYGWIIFEIGRAGYGAIRAEVLTAAKAVTAKRLLTEDERRALRGNNINLAPFENEALRDEELSDARDDEE